MVAYVKLDRVIVHEAHEDGGFLWVKGDGEWSLGVSVNNEWKWFQDDSVKDGDHLDLGKYKNTWVLDVDKGDRIEFKASASELDGGSFLDAWNQDDLIGNATKTIPSYKTYEEFASTVDSNSFNVWREYHALEVYEVDDFVVSSNDYTMHFDIQIL